MSFSANEQSESEGRPRELYWFMRGTDSWTYASGTDAYDLEGQTFTPVANLTRSSIRNGRERSRNQMTLDMPRDLPIAQEFRGIPQTEAVWLRIYRVHEGETDFRVTWQGRVRCVEFKGHVGTMTLDDIAGSTKKSSLRMLFQNQCNNFTFDENCGLLEADYSHAATVISVTANNLTADDSQAAGYYIAGQVKRANGDRRFIVEDTKVGSIHTLNLLTPFEDLADDEEVTLIGGACRHTFDTCPIQANYGGYPKVPRKNPFKSFH